jgi:methionyl-tRNA formyltransferase
VKRLVLERGLSLYQPPSLKQGLEPIAAAGPDVLVVAAYGLILPPQLLAIAPLGAINIHASLLPRWRGAAPIQRALLAGDTESGVSIMQMDAGLDTGPVLRQERMRISPDDDAGSLHDKLAALGAEAMVRVLADLQAGGVQGVPQPAAGVTYAAKIDKRETRLDWSRPAAELERAVRAFRPTPGATAFFAEASVKIWRAQISTQGGIPGSVLSRENALVVACGEGALAITELQRAGGRRVSAAEFLRGRSLPVDARFR